MGSNLVSAKSVLLDPLTCGSAVSYIITKGSRRISGDVHLSDCDRKVKWYFGYESSIDKIDNAIRTLTEFRDEFIEAQRTFKKPVKRTRKPRTVAAA